MDETRALLDELMGRARDAPLAERAKVRAPRFDDDHVCKLALAGLCPYRLFKNTRSDLGHCDKRVHEGDLTFDTVKAQWDALPSRERERYGWERELHALLSDLIAEGDRKVARNRERAAREAEGRVVPEADAARVAALRAEAKAKAAAASAAEAAGDVDAAAALTEEAEAARGRADALDADAARRAVPFSVCAVSGVLLQSGEGEAKSEEHLQGKQYQGWKAIRDAFAVLDAELATRPRAYAYGRTPPQQGDWRRRSPVRGGDRRRSPPPDWRDAHRRRTRSRSRDRGEGERGRRRSRSRSRPRDGHPRGRGESPRRGGREGEGRRW